MRPQISSLIHIGVRGCVVALDRRTGDEVWRAMLKGCSFVNVVLDGFEIYATTRGEIFCLDAATGQCLWNNPLRGLGYGLITVANSGQAPAAEQIHQEEAAAAATSTAVATA